MTLAIQSQETLDTLENLAIESFSSIPNNQQNKETFDHLTEPFKTEPSKFCKLYKMVPMQNIFQVGISWALPSLVKDYKSKPLHYLGTIIGHEGKGSLISHLRRKVWALQLCAGNAEDGFEHNSTYSAFYVSIVLTKSGYENLDKVLIAVFSYLKMLKKSGPSSRIFEEIKKVDHLDFEFGQQPQAIDNVEKLCEGMHKYPPAHYLTGSELTFEFDSTLIQDITQKLNEDTANILILSRDYQDIATKTEPWFKTKYVDEEMPTKWKNDWKNAEIFDEFHLPLPNDFIAENVSLLPYDSSKTEGNPTYPRKLKQDKSGELFYRLDDIFKQPRAIAIFNLRSPLARKSVENAVCLDLLVSCLGQIMITDTYAADQALLEHTVNVGERGEIVIKINGLNDKLTLLLKTILKHLSNLPTNPELSNVFNAVRDQTKKNYYNFFIHPSKLVRDVRLSVLQDVHWTAMEKHKAIMNVTINMVISFAKEFLLASNLYTQGLVQGNVTEDEAIRMHELVKDTLTQHETSNGTVVTDIRCNEVPNGQHFLRASGVNPKDTNTLITNYYQSSHASSLENHMMMEVALMLMEEPVFDILRTKEQLGYTVFSMLRNTYGILGLSITVNSQATKFSADHVNERIEAFLQWFVDNKLKKLEDEEFNHFVTTLIKVNIFYNFYTHT
jgi:nardilysin